MAAKKSGSSAKKSVKPQTTRTPTKPATKNVEAPRKEDAAVRSTQAQPERGVDAIDKPGLSPLR